jgi:hypothetical protein
MGREIRRVPPNWEHPKFDPSEVRYEWQRDAYKPLMEGYAEAKAGFEKMQAEKGLQEAIDYYGQAPDVNDYVPDWTEAEATWFQVYETVSEGSPVTPPFATREELVEYLVQHGDFWRQKDGSGGHSRKSAEAFVMGDGWVPSMVMENGKITIGIDIAGIDK